MLRTPRGLLAACSLLHAGVVLKLLTGKRHPPSVTIVLLALLAVVYAVAAYATARRIRWGSRLGFLTSGLESLFLAWGLTMILYYYLFGPPPQRVGWPEGVVALAVPLHVATCVAVWRGRR